MNFFEYDNNKFYTNNYFIRRIFFRVWILYDKYLEFENFY